MALSGRTVESDMMVLSISGAVERASVYVSIVRLTAHQKFFRIADIHFVTRGSLLEEGQWQALNGLNSSSPSRLVWWINNRGFVTSHKWLPAPVQISNRSH